MLRPARFIVLLLCNVLLLSAVSAGSPQFRKKSRSAEEPPSTEPQAQGSEKQLHLPDGDVDIVQGGDDPVLRFPVIHSHGFGYCTGYLYFSRARIRFQSLPSYPQDDAFDLPRAEVQVRRVSSLIALANNIIEINLRNSEKRYRLLHFPRESVERRTARGRRGFSGEAIVRAADHFDALVSALIPSSGAGTYAASDDPLDKLHNRVPASAAQGLYELDARLTFNVLDSVYFDPASGQLSLVGHRDPRYAGPRIPYLHHLATLLDSPRPEFTLNMTAESQRQVDRTFFDANSRFDLTSSQQLASRWGNLFDSSHHLTPNGKFVAIALGVQPTQSGQGFGQVGAQFAAVDGRAVRVQQVQPGSPAEQAGLRVGDLVEAVAAWDFHHSPLTPDEMDRNIRRAGAGSKVTFSITRPTTGEYLSIFMTLAPAPGDVWRDIDKDRFASLVMRAAGRNQAGRLVDARWTMVRYKDTPSMKVAFEYITVIIGAWGEMMDNVNLPQDQRSFANGVAFCRGTDRTLTNQGSAERAFRNAYRGPSTFEYAMGECLGELDRQAQVVLAESLDTIHNRPGGIQIAPEMIESTFGVHPEVAPEFIGIDSKSLLARAMFEGDYIGKRMMDRPELKRKIPRYQTEQEFTATHPQFHRSEASFHMWISVENVPVAVSSDGSTLSLGTARMRFNIREKGSGGRDLPPQPGGYEELLTSFYDDLSLEYPVLHELEESAKLGAAVEWIRAHDPRFRLDPQGRGTWNPPAKVGGLIYVNMHSSDSGGFKTTVISRGGVSLKPCWDGECSLNVGAIRTDSSLVPLRGNEVVMPQTYKNETLARVLHHEIKVPEYHPTGWFARANQGARALEALNVRTGAASCASGTLDEKVRRLYEVARQLDQTERLINMINAKQTERTLEFDRINKELQADREAYIQNSVDIVTQHLIDLRDALPSGTLKSTAEGVKEASALAGKVDKWRSRLETLYGGKSEETIRTLLDMMGEITDELDTASFGPAGRYVRGVVKTFNVAKDIKNVAALGTGILKLYFISDFRLEQLEKPDDAGLPKLQQLQLRFSEQVNQMREDPEVKAWLAGACGAYNPVASN